MTKPVPRPTTHGGRSLTYSTSALPFGSKSILFARNFRQIFPFVCRRNRRVIVMSSIKLHSLRREFEHFRLSRNMHTENDADLIAWLFQLSNGSYLRYGLRHSRHSRHPTTTGMRRCGFDRLI